MGRPFCLLATEVIVILNLQEDSVREHHKFQKILKQEKRRNRTMKSTAPCNSMLRVETIVREKMGRTLRCLVTEVLAKILRTGGEM
jgi:hypothetical protein